MAARAFEREVAVATRAVVLGGGGTVGIAWQSGLMAGLERGGVRPGDADLIVGTSAGSVVGAQLALGRAGETMLQRQREQQARALEPGGAVAAVPSRPTAAIGVAAALQFVSRRLPTREPPRLMRRGIGAFALRATPTTTEERFIERLGSLSRVAPGEWPERFVCTAVDARTGEFVTWRRGAGVGLGRAVASSCAVPGVFPPITIGGRRYIDGGVRSSTNADLARGHERVLVVAVIAGATARDARRRVEAEMARLRSAGSRVELVIPDAASAALFPVNGLDGSRRGDIAEAGAAQGEAEAGRLLAFWG